MLLDTDVVIDVLRGHQAAIEWFRSLGPTTITLPGFVAMELLQGCRNRVEQDAMQRQLDRFDIVWPSATDCCLAMELFGLHRLSHGIGLLDSLIAVTALGADEPLATFNVKHFGAIAALKTVQPY